MCGRFVSASDLEQVAAYFDAPLPSFAVRRSYNVSPTNDIVAVVGNGYERRLEVFRWGLVPPWSTSPGKGPPLFNARSETAASKNTFRRAFKRRRCIVPADGFYEWPRAHKGESGERGKPQQRPLPHYITRSDGDMLAMAGLWESWAPPGEETLDDPGPNSPGPDSPGPDSPAPDSPAPDRPALIDAGQDFASAPRRVLHSTTVLTTAANDFMAPIHHRMPVLLELSQWDAWLDPANDDINELSAMYAAAAPGILNSHQVGRAVGNVRNNDPSLIKPVETEEPAAAQSGLF